MTNVDSVEALEEFLDSQDDNSPDKPIDITMNADNDMIEKIRDVIADSKKYVSLTLSGSGLTDIGDYGFGNCEFLVSVTIPNGVTSIGENAFCYCKNLSSVTLPNSVTAIWRSAFEYCNALANITIPASVTEIDSAVFENCEKLTSVTFEGAISQDHARKSFSSDGDLCEKYLAGGPGTYTRESGSDTWTKK